MAGRIPLITTPITVSWKQVPDLDVSPIWFRWFQQVDAAINVLPVPPVTATQFQDGGVNVGVAAPEFVSFDDNLTATYSGTTVHVSAPDPGISDAPIDGQQYGRQSGAWTAISAPDSLLNVRIWQYIINSTGTPLDLGLGGGSSAGSTAVTTKDSTTWSGRQIGIQYTGTGLAGIVGLYGAVNYFRVGSAADGGGIDWYCFSRVGNPMATTAGLLCGMLTNPVAMTATPSSAFNFGFMGAYIDAGNANWMLGVRDRPSAVNSFDTGVAWAADQHFAVHVNQPKGNGSPAVITLRLFNSTTGAITNEIEHTFTTGFPSSGDELTWANLIYSATGTDRIQFFRTLAIVNDGAFSNF